MIIYCSISGGGPGAERERWTTWLLSVLERFLERRLRAPAAWYGAVARVWSHVRASAVNGRLLRQLGWHLGGLLFISFAGSPFTRSGTGVNANERIRAFAGIALFGRCGWCGQPLTRCLPD